MPVTAAGFERRTEAECIAAIVAECRATVDPDFDDSPDSASGQIVNIVGSKWAEAYEVLESVWNSLSEAGSGAQLDRIAALTGTYRQVGESDAALRLRRREELADQGATTQPALRAAVSKVPGVTAVRVVSNRTAVTVDGRPPKSVETLVLGSFDPAALAGVIYDNLAAGIQAYGTTLQGVTDPEGYTEQVGYTVVAAARWYVRLDLEVDEGSFAGPPAVQEAVRTFSAGGVLELTNGRTIAGGIELGGMLYRSRIAAAAQTVQGVTAVLAVRFRLDPADPWLDADVPVGVRSYLGNAGVRGFEPDHIEVVGT